MLVVRTGEVPPLYGTIVGGATVCGGVEWEKWAGGTTRITGVGGCRMERWAVLQLWSQLSIVSYVACWLSVLLYLSYILGRLYGPNLFCAIFKVWTMEMGFWINMPRSLGCNCDCKVNTVWFISRAYLPINHVHTGQRSVDQVSKEPKVSNLRAVVSGSWSY